MFKQCSLVQSKRICKTPFSADPTLTMIKISLFLMVTDEQQKRPPVVENEVLKMSSDISFIPVCSLGSDF
jgi:hypothetical protein